ncbi:hypothetical protein V5799_030560 [Amblyomma americanum]|uniref:Uncharacterized protein n=1 Tax=Amblyomma americanum TaxID=6943 RepID=A0AAQ4EMW2_AMBAM
MDGDSELLPCDFLSSEEMILPSEKPRSPLVNDGEEDRETFEGEGSEEVVARTDDLGSSSVVNALNQLVELCDAPESGIVALDKLMDVIESQGFQCSPQDIHSLNQVYSALCAESESKGLVTTGGSGKRDFQVDIHNSKVIRDLFDHYQSHAHIEGMWEPGLSLLLDPRILASLEVSMFSTGSKEGTGGDISFLDVAQYEAECAQHQHTVQRLMKEKEDAMRQWSQLDEAHQALAATNKDLVERVRSLCHEVESLKRACSELEETKASLAATSAACRQAEQLLTQARAAKAALEGQLEKRIAEVDSLNERLAKCQDGEKRAVLVASQHRQHLRELEARNRHLEAQLSQEASRLDESSAAIEELTSTVESLKQTWKDKEDELRQERAENCRLKELLFERSTSLHGSDVNGDAVEAESGTMTSAEGNLDSDEGVFNSRSISPASVIFFSADSCSRTICDELSLSALDLQCTSTPRPPQSPVRRSRLPFCGIPRLPTWDCSAIQQRYSDEGLLNSVLLSQSNHSSLPPRITALVQENLASAGAEALQAKLEQELKKKEEVIKELEAKVSKTKDEQSALERRQTELWCFLGVSLIALKAIRCDLQMLNDEAVRVLESHAGASSILAVAQQDRQLVSALEDVSPESAYSFPEDVVREQIQLELQTLRAQITKSQAVLTYLQSRGSRTLVQPVSECATIDRKALVRHRGYSEEGVHPDDRHYDTLEAHRKPRRSSGCQACGCVGRCRGRHAGRLSSTLSCPALPARDTSIGRSTQTEPTTTTTMRSRDCQTDDELDTVSVDMVRDDASVVPEIPVEATARTTSSLPGDLSPPFPRHRSNSFVCAIQGGNKTPDEGRGASGERRSAADTSSAKPKVPTLTFEDFDAQRRDPNGQTRKAAFRKCLLEVGRSVAMDLDQPDGSTGTPRPRVRISFYRLLYFQVQSNSASLIASPDMLLSRLKSATETFSH